MCCFEAYICHIAVPLSPPPISKNCTFLDSNLVPIKTITRPLLTFVILLCLYEVDYSQYLM